MVAGTLYVKENKAASSSSVDEVYDRNVPLLLIAIASPLRCVANYDI
jgi:hypothetical protein